MDDAALAIGEIFLILGGLAMAGVVLGLALQGLCRVWAEVFYRFRVVRTGEELVREYLKEKDGFEYWKAHRMEFEFRREVNDLLADQNRGNAGEIGEEV